MNNRGIIDLWVQIKYANLLSVQLSRFKLKQNNPYVANFKCPFCEFDQSTKKCRGYLYQKGQNLSFHCHNCGRSHLFKTFIEHVNDGLYKEFILDAFEGNVEQKEILPDIKTETESKFVKNPLKAIKKISQLAYDHPAKKYIEKRKISNFWHSQLYYAPKFAAFVNSLIPGKLPTINDEPRLIIPFFDEKGKLFGFQGRAFSKTELRYITIMLDTTKSKIWGLNLIDFDAEKVYITEGALDATFIPNCLAMAGADASTFKMRSNMVKIYDNEPRNSEIVGRMLKELERGNSVCIWPDNIKQKDINDMVLNGYNPDVVKRIIDENIYSGQMGILRLNEWKRC